MEISENEVKKGKPCKQPPPPPLPTTEELCTLCTQYVVAYTFQLEQV